MGSNSPTISRVAKNVDGFDLILEDVERPAPFGLFEVGYAIKANYPYFTYLGQTYETIGGGSVVIRNTPDSSAKFIVREVVVSQDKKGRVTRSLLRIVEKQTGNELARRDLVSGAIENSTGWTGDHALQFVRSVLQPPNVSKRPWGIADYPAADVQVTYIESNETLPYPHIDLSGNCPPSLWINRKPSNSTVMGDMFEFLPRNPLTFAACDSGLLIIASGTYANTLNLDLLTQEGVPLAQGQVRLPLPIEASLASIADLRLTNIGIQLRVLTNRRQPDFKQKSYRQILIAGNLIPIPKANVLP